jgi:hypothetical protein
MYVEENLHYKEGHVAWFLIEWETVFYIFPFKLRLLRLRIIFCGLVYPVKNADPL